METLIANGIGVIITLTLITMLLGAILTIYYLFSKVELIGDSPFWEKFSVLTVSIIFTIVAAIAISVSFYFYASQVNSESQDIIARWDALGSVLSGFFAPAAAFSILITMIYFQRQLKEQKAQFLMQVRQQQNINEKQIESLEFERYDKHRRIFFERIDYLAEKYKGNILFRDKENLYERLYPENSPSLCKVKLKDHHGSIIREIEESMSTIRSMRVVDAETANTIIFNYSKLHGLLDIKVTTAASDGDVYTYARKLCLNVLVENMGNAIIEDIIKSIYVYGGIQFNHAIILQFNYTKTTEILKQLYENKVRDEIISITDENPRIRKMYEVREHLIKLGEEKNEIEQKLTERLNEKFWTKELLSSTHMDKAFTDYLQQLMNQPGFVRKDYYTEQYHLLLDNINNALFGNLIRRKPN
ncbi:hypothetical protein ACUN9V_09655 [Salinicola sp. V024]|uniref:hypothetical protein n=1 Tax=Salinicola sp. V024 TaxID=3459609 RepID=UPI0040449A70